jgi:hypothetical protein
MVVLLLLTAVFLILVPIAMDWAEQGQAKRWAKLHKGHNPSSQGRSADDARR